MCAPSPEKVQLHTQQQVPGVTSGGVKAVWNMNIAHATSSSETGPCWSCTDLLQLLSQGVSRRSQFIFPICALFSQFFELKVLKDDQIHAAGWSH